MMSHDEQKRIVESRLPWGLAGMLVAVGVVEHAMAGRPLEVSSTATLSWRLSREAATREAKSAEVVCLGDSLMKHGVLPRLLEARTGRRSYNLAVCAAQPPAAYLLFSTLLRSGANPSAIVVDFAPGLMVGGPRYSLRNWSEVAGLCEIAELAARARDWALLGELVSGMMLPSLRARFEIRAWIAAALVGQANPYLESNLLYRRNWLVNKGANLSPPNAQFKGVVGEDEHRRQLSSAWWCHRVNRDYFHALLRMTQARGISVYWLMAPVSPPIQLRRDQSGAEARHLAFVRTLLDRYPNLAVIDARHAGYDSSIFVDSIHLDGRGAMTLSTDLAAVLRKRLGGVPGPRWEDLPRYRALALDPEFEDVEGSRLALRLRAKSVR
jgi:hypothetical protein